MTFDEYVRYAGSPENLAHEAFGGDYRPDGGSRGHQQAARPGESAAQTKERGMREFVALQGSPFFDLWAAAAIDEILSALHEKLAVGDA